METVTEKKEYRIKDAQTKITDMIGPIITSVASYGFLASRFDFPQYVSQGLYYFCWIAFTLSIIAFFKIVIDLFTQNDKII